MRPRVPLAKLVKFELLETFQAIAKANGTSLDEVWSRDRHGHVVRARAQMMQMCRERFNWGYDVIGAFFERDHSSVMYLLKSDVLTRESERRASIRLEGLTYQERFARARDAVEWAEDFEALARAEAFWVSGQIWGRSEESYLRRIANKRLEQLIEPVEIKELKR